jgi:REP-associated tyrosine transposase
VPRKPRLHLPGGLYHVVLRGNGRQPIFRTNDDRWQWQSFLGLGLARYQHRVHAYCWMSNHIHMAIQAGAEPLAGFMRFVASRYARYFNRETGRPGHLFERRYRAILVQQDEYLLELVRYIHLNPVRARMVTDPADYQWSSHNAYLQKRRADWLTVDFVAGLFDTNRRGARLAYARFMTAQPTDTTLQLLRNGISEDDRILGDDSWTKDVLASRHSPVTHRNFDDLVQDTCRRYRITESALASRSRSRLNSNIRAEIALAATNQGIATVTEVAKRFGRAHSGLSRALNRLRDQRQ